MCGQMCGNPLYTMLLLGMGLRSMSVTPAAIPEIKQVCRSVSTRDSASKWPSGRWSWKARRDVKTYLKEELAKVLPELPV